jgi:hypothetical protein
MSILYGAHGVHVYISCVFCYSVAAVSILGDLLSGFSVFDCLLYL